MKTLQQFFSPNNKVTKPKLYALIIFAVVFTLWISISIFITFEQNDDWVYYQMARNFAQGNFELDPWNASTFIVQGIVAIPIIKLFSSKALPILTALISFLNFIIFYLILGIYYVKQWKKRLLVSLIFLLNPLHVYSSFGFMTENYFIFFLLLSILFFLKYTKIPKLSYFILATICTFLGVFTKQTSLVTFILFFVYFVSERQWKRAIGQGIITGFTYLIWHQTSQSLYKQQYELELLLNPQRLFTFMFAFLIYSTAFSIPLILNNYNRISKKGAFGIIFGLMCTIQITISNPYNFPYLINVFSKSGFHSVTLLGTRSFGVLENIFNVWGFVGILCSLVFIIEFVLRKKSVETISLVIYIACFSILLIPLPYYIYDRYIISITTVFLLVAVTLDRSEETKRNLFTLLLFLVFLAYINYQYIIEYIQRNAYVWQTSTRLVEKENIKPEEILATSAWVYLFPTTDAKYIFTYDIMDKNKYQELEYFEINYPFSLFEKNKIYLYEKLSR